MKKIIFILTILLIYTASSWADNDRVTNDVNELPANSREFISNYFRNVDISHIKIEKKIFGNKNYEVILTNGVEIEFDNSGNWMEIDANRTNIPKSILTPEIIKYIDTNFPGNEVVAIKRDANKWEVELTNDMELTFNRQGKLIEIDR